MINSCYMATISTTGAVVGVLTECTADLCAAGRDVDVDDAAIGAKRPVDIQKELWFHNVHIHFMYQNSSRLVRVHHDSHYGQTTTQKEQVTTLNNVT